MLIATPSQTVGPYFRLGMDPLNHDHVAPLGASGLIKVSGRVIDGDQAPIGDCVLEIWQADAAGQYAFIEGKRNPKADPQWNGFARVPTDADGRFTFYTVKPGGVADNHGGVQAPHALVMVGMRGLLKFLMTRMYFPAPVTASDAVLQSIPAARRATLIATESAPGQLDFNINMQGPGETVFFDY
jgi:protocatechuate 3,4-dioxygenase alpha subunit